jgi:acetyl-CoA acetyltransferase
LTLTLSGSNPSVLITAIDCAANASFNSITSMSFNVNGGAIALGHPLGCTGAKLTASILRELERRNGRYGMVTMCVGGGMGAAGILERLN